MTDVHYTGLNRNNGGTLSDMAHIRQSVSDILTTPKGSRLMRRDYGSDLLDLIDGPLNPAMRLKVISAAYSALSQWEPRIAISAITAENSEGRIVIIVKGARCDTGKSVTISTTLTNSPETSA